MNSHFKRALLPAAVWLASLAVPDAGALPDATVFVGMCDASAAAAIDADRFVVADDEDNILRIYSRAGGKPLQTFDVSEFLGVQGKKKSKETDLEAAAQLGDHTFWITSHGRNSKGKDKPERQRLFATRAQIRGDSVEIVPVGQPYSDLLADLLADPQLAPYKLAAASELAPKAPGGLNIEGLAATPEGHLLIGFRNPLHGGAALIVPLLNPRQICNGEKAKFGPPRDLDLGKLGVRSLEYCAGRYIVIAGDPGEGSARPQLFEWDGKSKPQLVSEVTLGGLNPEGIAFRRGSNDGEYFILSDDGARDVSGQPCKNLKDPNLKSFRGRVVKF